MLNSVRSRATQTLAGLQSMRNSLILLALLAGYVSPASADTFLTFPGQLSSTDTALNLLNATVNGGSAAAATVGSVYSSSSITFSNSNNALTFSGAANGYEIDQVGATYGSSAFVSPTILLGAGGFQGPSGGPVTLTFAVPVVQFGLSIEDFNSGTYSLTMNIFDAAGKNVALGYSGNDSSLTGNDPYSLSFEGFTVTGDNIKKIIFDDGTDNLMFGDIEYLNVGGDLQAPPPAVPEPASIALLGLGLLGLASVRCSNKSQGVR